jgi:hypothetical protein
VIMPQDRMHDLSMTHDWDVGCYVCRACQMTFESFFTDPRACLENPGVITEIRPGDSICEEARRLNSGGRP